MANSEPTRIDAHADEFRHTMADSDSRYSGKLLLSGRIPGARRTPVKALYVAVVAAVAIAAALALAAREGKPEAVRRILERHDQSGVPGKEIVIGTSTLSSGAIIGFHTHPGDEAGYVVRGTLILKTRGRPDRVLHSGDSFFNPRGAIHMLQATDSDGLAVSSWIVDTGAPLATPVP
jgi:quercetin dioxygenase-like cupin family protein